MVSYSDIEESYKLLTNVVHKTPILKSSTFNKMVGFEAYFKAENFQRIGAFKIRGAYNKIVSLSQKERDAGVIAHSSGNHAQGVALVCKLLKIKAVAVMPINSVKSKIEATKSYGAEVIFCGENTDDRQRMTDELIAKYGYTLVPPYDDEKIIAGQGTVGLEIFEDMIDLDYLFVPVGGGGLISGCAVAAKHLSPRTKVIGVETDGANDCYQSFREKRLVKLATTNTIADGMRTLSVGKRNFEIIMKFVDDVITVSDNDVITMMRFFFERMKIVVEPTGAVAAAAILKNVLGLKNKKVCAVISGGNIDQSKINEWLG